MLRRADSDLEALAELLPRLGDPSFLKTHGLRFACVSGAMANGIASVEIVEAMSRAGMLGFFGAAGLSVERVEAALDRLKASLGSAPWGMNLIHSPNEPALEDAIVDLYLKKGVRLVEASAYLDLTPAIVRYRATGLRRGRGGEVFVPNRVIAKVSRVEVARKFLYPAPEGLLRDLAASGKVTAEEAALAAEIPLADDLTAEADSGGHTDNR
ncbi:MAG TPA: 2-nitropropane dioxygenase, partial [Elusimicrobiota bacterium]|nr:2-nitropropane dioxygenase [Elusimicrobiota bacterium]